MVILEIEDLIEYGIAFIREYNRIRGFPDSDDFYDERAEIAIQQIMARGLAVVPCNPEDPRMKTPYFTQTEKDSEEEAKEKKFKEMENRIKQNGYSRKEIADFSERFLETYSIF